ncbi:MAG: ribosome-associated translation inhibitor RaiA [Simkaniaceae bacterium]|nr:ribosome-associated translation inhibitor RaiA [Simkaniaceae bacterium]
MAERANWEEQYRIHIVAKHIDQTDAIQNHIMDKLSKLDKLTHNIIDVHVRLEIQKTEHRCNLTLKFSHFKIQTHASTTDMYASIDKAIERMCTKVRKWKDKIDHHHQKQVEVDEVEVEVVDVDEINEMIEEENEREIEEAFALPKVEKTKTIPIKMLTLDEAMMKMELSNDVFMIFKSEEEQNLKVIYRRRDNSYGLITPKA